MGLTCTFEGGNQLYEMLINEIIGVTSLSHTLCIGFNNLGIYPLRGIWVFTVCDEIQYKGQLDRLEYQLWRDF